ncbi:MAG: hypothetical protein OXF27_10905 [Acidobacteria bacterium]|nr:hypothetical protein [Acidobacteriota bacterium]
MGTEARDLREWPDETTARASGDREGEIVYRLLGAAVEAEAVSFVSFNRTLEFMRSLPSELPLPIVVVESEDEIGLDWDEDPQRVVSLTIDSSDRIGYSALFGREPIYGRVYYIDDGLPETLRDVLARLYPSAELG